MPSPRKPLESRGQNEKMIPSAPAPDVDADDDPVPQHLRLKRGGHLRPGDLYTLAGTREAIMLAHSQEKPIPRDPKQLAAMTFVAHDYRALHRLGAHPLRRLYDDVLFRPIADIVQESRLQWTQFGAYRQGWSAESDGSVPTLIVWSVPIQQAHHALLQTARGLADKLDELLAVHNLTDVHVEIAAIYSSVPYGDAKEVLVTSGMTSLYDPILPGISIGEQDGTASGTFSGFVRVQLPDAAKTTTEATDTATRGKGAGPEADVFGLTCHHVAALDRRDFFLPLLSEDNVTLSSPSAADHKRYVQRLQKLLEALNEEVDEREKSKEERLMIGRKWTPYLQGALDDALQQQSRIRTTLEHVQACWDNDHRLGRVLRSSGITAPDVGDAVADWALVQLDTGRLQQDGADWPPSWIHSDYRQRAVAICADNDVPRVPGHVIDLLQDAESCSAHDDEQLLSASAIHAIAREDAPVYVVLRGRSTPFGVGVLHDVCDGVHTTYGRGAGAQVIVSRELTALDVGERSPANNAILSTTGDAGAPVRLLSDGQLLGIVFSSHPRDPIGKPTTHISVAETVATKIQQATGAERVTFVGRHRALVSRGCS